MKNIFLKIVIMLFLAVIISSFQTNKEKGLLFQSQNYKLFKDSVTWKEFKAEIINQNKIITNYPSSPGRQWEKTYDISAYPIFTSDIPLLNAMYVMSLEELEKLKTDEGLFNTGALWGGVWTRDYSQSINLALSYLTPDISKKGLMLKTKDGIIIQDTGTGGSWPVSTDRMIWAIAAWNVYTVTGEKEWLKTVYPIIKKSVERDQKTVVSNLGLLYGETTTMDWRENSYPSWMKSTEIYQSLSLSTNAIHYKTYDILSQMAGILGEPTTEFEKIANSIKDAINTHLWNDSLGYYVEYLYGKNYPMAENRSDAMGEALCIQFDIANKIQQFRIIAKTPVLEYGIPLFYPFKPDAFSYHNNSVWPYVQAQWNISVAKLNNFTALEHGLASIYRPAAIFLSNKENMVASNGSEVGTAMNSDRQLWSVAANLAMTYRVLMGMQFEPGKLVFEPKIPKAYDGIKKIENFNYRKSVLNITVKGFGSKIKSFSVDGKKQDYFEIQGDLKGKHDIVIFMENNEIPPSRITIVQEVYSPQEPVLTAVDKGFIWNKNEYDMEYHVYLNGKLVSKQDDAWFKVTNYADVSEYQVRTVAKNGIESFLSAPLVYGKEHKTITLETENFTQADNLELYNYSGTGYVETTTKKNTNIKISFKVKDPGQYRVSFRYSNATSPMCCLNTCAVRSLFLNGSYEGAVLMPVVEYNNWSNWYESSSLELMLNNGDNILEIKYMPDNENMNTVINHAILDYVSLVKIK